MNRTLITAAASAALLTGRHMGENGPELIGTRAVDKIAQDQRDVLAAKKAMNRSVRRATNALVQIGQKQIVLGHIHPRWLRKEVEQLLDLGVEVDQSVIDVIRAREALRCK